jgi:competence protein ComEC
VAEIIMSQWPLHKAYFWERLPFFRILLPFVAGILCYSFITTTIPASVIVSIAVGSIALFVSLLLLKKQTTVTNVLSFIAANIFLITTAWLTAYNFDERNNEQWFGHYMEDAAGFAVTVSEKPAEKERTWKVPVTIEHVFIEGKPRAAIGKGFIYLYKDEQPLPYQMGDKLIVPSHWQRIRNAANPFEFDYAAYAARNNLYYQQFLAQHDVMIYQQATQLPLWVRMHEWAMAELAHYVKDKPTLGLIQAMLVGDDANMDTDLRQAYAETGIIHIVAISGSHITIFFFMVTFLLGWIRNKKYHWLKYIIAIPLIWMYVLIAGLPPSAVRASCMFSLLGIGLAFQKQHNSINQLLATAFILLLAQPNWLYAVGFQLSFLAVLSIVLFYPPIYRLWLPANKIIRSLWAAAAVSIAAEILVAPLVVYYFHLFPAMFLVANVMAYLFMGIILLLGMLLIACSNIVPLATFIAWFTTLLVGIFNQLVQVFRTCNPEWLGTLLLTGFQLLCIYAIITSAAVYIGRKKRTAVFTTLLASVALLASFIIGEYNTLHRQQLVVYNISRINHVEWIQGHSYRVLVTDTAYPARKKNYVLKPAHIGYRSWKEVKGTTPEMFRVGSHTVLMLSAASQLSKPQHADYVLINYKATPADMAFIKAAINPKMAIMGNNLTRRRQEAIAEAATAVGLPLHITGHDGAFILQGR